MTTASDTDEDSVKDIRELEQASIGIGIDARVLGEPGVTSCIPKPMYQQIERVLRTAGQTNEFHPDHPTIVSDVTNVLNSSDPESEDGAMVEVTMFVRQTPRPFTIFARKRENAEFMHASSAQVESQQIETGFDIPEGWMVASFRFYEPEAESVEDAFGDEDGKYLASR